MCHQSTLVQIFPKGIQNCCFGSLQPPFISIWIWHESSEDISQQSILSSLTLVGPTRLAHILRSLFYRRLLSTLVKPTKTCFWEVICFRNFPHSSSFHFLMVPVISQSLVVIPWWLILCSWSSSKRTQVLNSNPDSIPIMVASHLKSLVITNWHSDSSH